MSYYYRPRPVRRARPLPPPPPPAPSELWDDLKTTIWVRARHDTQLDPPIGTPPPIPPPVAIAIDPAVQRPRRTLMAVLLSLWAALVGSALVVGAHFYLKNHWPVDAGLFEAKLDGVRETRQLLARAHLPAGENTRAFHWKSAKYRDLWQQSEWFHPLADEVFMPGRSLRKFGAKRPGPRPNECGRGHCGVDLGHFGLPVRAARPGVVDRVQRTSSKKEGRYVRIVHDDGFVTYYMHLHKIRSDLEKGMRVDGGEVIGIVGRTGIKRSPPHLHFALAYIEGRQKVFIDPEPLLRRSVSVEDQANF